MGLIRKITSVSSLGAVDFKSDKERIATYTKQTRNELRKLNERSGANSGSPDTPWIPGQTSMTVSDALASLELLLNQRKFGEYKGYGASITFRQNEVVVTRKGAVARLQKLPEGENVINFSDICMVVSQDPNLATNGFINPLTVTSNGIGSGTSNNVLFTNQHKKEFRELLEILRAIAEVNHCSLIERGREARENVQTEEVVKTDFSSRLDVLNDLLEKGLISQEEYQIKRQTILDGL